MHKIEAIYKTNISHAPSDYKLSNKDIKLIANTLAVSFQNYPLFEYFACDKYNLKKMKLFWKVNLKTLSERAIIIGDSEAMNSLAIFSPYEKNEFSIWKYIKAGGFLMALSMGPKSVKRMTEFEELALKIKAKYATPNCWYFYTFVTLPEFRGKGVGSKVIHQVMDFLDERKQDCYLETLLPINVFIYQKFGFELKEEVKVPNTDLTIYALFRKYKEK